MTKPSEHSKHFKAWENLAESGSFEEAFAAMEEAVSLLEQGGMPLADMTECYELGLRLSKRCATLLREAELKITQLDESFQADSASLAISATPTLFDLNG
jgi:exodeoxyribonuclease VII small subunit